MACRHFGGSYGGNAASPDRKWEVWKGGGTEQRNPSLSLALRVPEELRVVPACARLPGSSMVHGVRIMGGGRERDSQLGQLIQDRPPRQRIGGRAAQIEMGKGGRRMRLPLTWHI